MAGEAGSTGASPSKNQMKMFSARLSTDDIDRIRSMAAGSGLTASECLRQAVDAHTTGAVGGDAATSRDRPERVGDLHLRLAPPLRDAVAVAAHREDMSMSGWVRQCIDMCLSPKVADVSHRSTDAAPRGDANRPTKAGGNVAGPESVAERLGVVTARLEALADALGAPT